MFKITLIQLISSCTLHLWLSHFAPYYLQVLANGDFETERRSPINGNILDPFSTFVSSPFARSYATRGSVSSSVNNPLHNTSFLYDEFPIPRLPAWNGPATNNDQQRQIDFSQLFKLMGEPRGSPGRELSELIIRPRPKCNRRIRILNGVTRIRERGSLARFQCSHGFTLIGPTTIVCLRDNWSEPPPICVKSGCRSIRRPQNAEVRHSIGGAVVAFYCLGETKLAGDPILFCDGIRWNGTEPTCEMNSVITTTPEPDQDETWPESAETPSPWISLVGHTEQDVSWDKNLQTVTLEVTTALPHVKNSVSPQWFRTASEKNIEQNGQGIIISTSGDGYPTTMIVTDEQRTSEEPVTKVEAFFRVQEEDTMTDKIRPNEEIPVAVTTEKPFIVTTAMGQSETHPAVTVSAVLVTSEVTPHHLAPTQIPEQPTQVNPLTIIPEDTITAPPAIVEVISSTSTTTKSFVPIPPRRIKIVTKRPRRPQFTRRPARRPVRRTTTTIKPRRPKLPNVLTFTSPLPPPQLPPVQTFSTSILPSVIPTTKQNDHHSALAVDYPVAIDKTFLPREHVEPIRPIIFPDMLNNNVYQGGGGVPNGEEFGHTSIIVGIVLVVVGLSTFSGAVVLYCWRKNKGIARARPYDMDGRTLSAHDANDDFMWMDQRDSVL